MSAPPSTTAGPRRTEPARKSPRKLLISWLIGGGSLILALALNYRTGLYIERIGPTLTPAHDLLFEYLPMQTFPFIHTWGFIGFVAVMTLGVLLDKPLERAPFILWAYALIVAARAVFTVLTPLGLPTEAPTFDAFPIQSFFHNFDFRHTMFFSGHTAFPFLGFLLSRQWWARWACLGFCLMLATSVLMSRLHYSIDVGAAFFFAYAVSHLARRSWRSLLRLFPAWA